MTTSGKLPIKAAIAGVVKLVDALDSKSSGSCIHAGSIPAPGTNNIKGLAVLAIPFFGAEIMDCARNCAHLRIKVGLLLLCSQFKVGVVYDIITVKY